MYMDEKDINDLIPVIRHLGMNLFFITNTPGNLPESVFRLLDNLIMSKIVNVGDIRRVEACGLVDNETIECFAPQLPEHHALILSSKDGITKTFPLVFKVDEFPNLPKSGVTRSMWEAIETNIQISSPVTGNIVTASTDTMISDEKTIKDNKTDKVGDK